MVDEFKIKGKDLNEDQSQANKESKELSCHVITIQAHDSKQKVKGKFPQSADGAECEFEPSFWRKIVDKRLLGQA